MRNWKYPRRSPTFCVCESTGVWQIVYILNELNDAVVAATKPVPKKDVFIDDTSKKIYFR